MAKESGVFKQRHAGYRQMQENFIRIPSFTDGCFILRETFYGAIPITGMLYRLTRPKPFHHRLRRLPTYVDLMTITCWDNYHLVLMPSLGSRSGRCNSRCGPVRRGTGSTVPDIRKTRRQDRGENCVQLLRRRYRNFAAALRRLSAINRTVTLTYRFSPKSGRWVA